MQCDVSGRTATGRAVIQMYTMQCDAMNRMKYVNVMIAAVWKGDAIY